MLVIKIGGNEIDDPAFVARLVAAVAQIQPTPVLVHGGGKEVGALQALLGGTPQFVDGRRVTDATARKAAAMVLCGDVSTRLVAALNLSGVDAIGLSGVDRGLVRVEPQDAALGFVGRPVAVRAEVLHALLADGTVPVLAPISLGPDGAYNVNADEIAGAVAAAIGAEEVVFVTNVPGVLVAGARAAQISRAEVVALIADGTISGGMVPKVQSALAALDAGVAAARIVDLAGLGVVGMGTRIVG